MARTMTDSFTGFDLRQSRNARAGPEAGKTSRNRRGLFSLHRSSATSRPCRRAEAAAGPFIRRRGFFADLGHTPHLSALAAELSIVGPVIGARGHLILAEGHNRAAVWPSRACTLSFALRRIFEGRDRHDKNRGKTSRRSHMVTAISENERLLEKLTTQKLARKNSGRPVTRKQMVEAMKLTIQRVNAQRLLGEGPFDFSRAIRGMCALRHNPIVPEWAEEDAAYTRALSPSTTPGSYLVPIAAADAILSQLAQTATGRASGARIWPMRGLQDMNVPVAVASPTFVWQAQDSRQTPTDPNLTGISFSLKLSQALILMPLQLFRNALPQWSTVLEDSFSLGLAESEDLAMHASATLANAPLAIMS